MSAPSEAERAYQALRSGIVRELRGQLLTLADAAVRAAFEERGHVRKCRCYENGTYRDPRCGALPLWLPGAKEATDGSKG